MRIQRVVIKHFRSIQRLDLDITPTTILAGPNSCGKSNVLRAIRFAFVPTYDSVRVAQNFPVFITGPSALISVCLTFNSASSELATLLGIPATAPFTYEVSVSRNAKAKFKINGKVITVSQRSALLADFQIVYVPPIRDIASGGLDPLKGLLARALRNAKKGRSIASLNQVINSAIETKGGEVLARADKSFGSISNVGEIFINTTLVDSGFALEQLTLDVDIGTGKIPLEALGTGHQSQVVMNLFGSLGEAFSGQVLYMFEEPDNHLHPTALIAVADKMRKIADTGAAQVFASSHSAAFIGSFPIADVVVLDQSDGETGKRKRLPSASNRRMHALLARYGRKPIEALLARAVVLVEGPTDVSIIRGLAAARFKTSPEQRDVLLVPCGGKTQVAELYQELLKLGVVPYAVLDQDAALGGSPAYISGSGSSAAVAAATSVLLGALNPASKRIVKSLRSIERELQYGPPAPQSFSGSAVETVVKASGKVNAADQSRVAAALARGRRTIWRGPLSNANVWVWKTDPEDVLSSLPNCVIKINRALSRVGSSVNPLPNGASKDEVWGWLHNNASEPETHELIVCELLESVGWSGEIGDFSRFIGGALSLT